MNVKINIDEGIDDLQLKGLKLIQKQQGFRFGVDAVLLSDFANIKNKRHLCFYKLHKINIELLIYVQVQVLFLF